MNRPNKQAKETKLLQANAVNNDMNISINPRSLLTPLDEAVSEIRRRRQDPLLAEKVLRYLDGDVPIHFDAAEPILYMARHIATPNHETLRFSEIAHTVSLPAVIGQDVEDIFSSNNILKRNLAKLPIARGVAHNGDTILEKVTIVDFTAAQGKQLCEISTVTGESLVSFHERLFWRVNQYRVTLVHESDWVTRNHRGNLFEHYKRQLALLIVHGVMFEYYEPDDQRFVDSVLAPAYQAVSEHFGLAPLIVDLVEPSLEHSVDWNGYPAMVYDFVKHEFLQIQEPVLN